MHVRTWAQVKKKLAATYEKFEKKGLQLPEQLRQRAKSKLFGGNDDKDVVYHSGIALVIAATKYDKVRVGGVREMYAHVVKARGILA